MKYLKRLKKELADLTEKLRGQVFDTMPSHGSNRARALQSLVMMLKEVRYIEHATDYWTEENAQSWFNYLSRLEAWLSKMPKLPEEKPSSEKAA
jgi:hypothetical protein